MLEINKIHQGDCLELMKEIPDKSIDMILCDLPYGTTACSWDIIIPLDKLWEQYKRIIKDKGFIVLTASQPFTTELIYSNKKGFKYCWVWDKGKGSNFVMVKKQPLKIHEEIIVFGNGTYNPQMVKGENKRDRRKENAMKNGIKNHEEGAVSLRGYVKHSEDYNPSLRYPKSIIKFGNHLEKENRLHPTQKPLELFKYLIKTYSNDGDLVLDNCIGSGTTAVACKQLNRDFIGIEKEQKYVDIANKRLSQCVFLAKSVGDKDGSK